MDSSVEADTSVTAHPVLSVKVYSQLLRSLSDHLVKRDIRKIKFLCHDLVEKKSFLDKTDLGAFELFHEMDRNGTLSPEDVRVLSQIMCLIGKKKLQKEVLNTKGIPAWNPGMKSILPNFRHFLYQLYQEIRQEDLEMMKKYCLLTGKLANAEMAEVKDALDLFSALTDRQEVTPDNIEFLCSLVQGLHSVRLNKMVTAYKENFLKSKDLKSKESDMSPPKSTATTGSTPISSGSYMNETGAGPSLKLPSHFRPISERKDFRNASQLKDKDSVDDEKSGQFSAISSSTDQTTHYGQQSSIDKATGVTCMAQMPAGPEPLIGPSSVTSSETEQAEIVKKTTEITEKIRTIGASGGGELGVTCMAQMPAGPESLIGPSSVTSSEKEQAEIVKKTTIGAHGGSPEETMTGRFSKMDLDENDYNRTVRTEGDEVEMERIKREEAKQAPKNTAEMDEVTELGAQGKEKMREVRERGQELESPHRGKEKAKMDCQVSEPMAQEEEKLRKVREKEQKLESTNGEKAPMQETGGAARGTELSTLSMIQRPVERPERSGSYPMTKDPKGICLLLMYDEFDTGLNPRTGHWVDQEKLVELFGEILNFEVILKHNTSFQETQDIIENMQETKEHGDCFVCFVCSHGNGESFFTKDGKAFHFQDLYDYFAPDKCPALIGKPKVFFMNLCLRESKDRKFQEFTVCSEDIASDGPEAVGIGTKLEKLQPKHDNFFIAYSTVAGYSSARHTTDGTFYVQNLYKVFKEKHQNFHLSELSVEVRKSINEQFLERPTPKICQVPTDLNTLTRSLYF